MEFKDLYMKLDNKITEIFCMRTRITSNDLKEMRETLLEMRIRYYYDMIDSHIPHID